MLKALPYKDSGPHGGAPTIFEKLHTDRGSVAYADILDWKAQTDLFTAVAAYSDGTFTITGGEEPKRIQGCSPGTAIPAR